MGVCFSASKVSGSNSNTNTTAVNHHRRGSTANPQSSTTNTKQDASRNQNQKKPNDNPKRNSQQLKIKEKNVSRRQSGVIPCGKRTDFGYDKNFDERYTIGKLLGHGQFGYTYVAIDKANGDRVAVKKIEKNKVSFLKTHDICFSPP